MDMPGIDAQAPKAAAAEQIDEDCLAAIDFELTYQNGDVRHRERRHAPAVNMWRDVFPPGLDSALMGKRVGDRVVLRYAPRELAGERQASLVQTISARDFDGELNPANPCRPVSGRYLPQGTLYRARLAGVYRDSRRPYRVIEAGPAALKVDLNHPFAGYSAEIVATVRSITRKLSDGGGRCQDWPQQLTDGAGMQFRAAGRATDFLVDDWARRIAEGADAEFYSVPRLVAHLDQHACETVREIHSELLPVGGAVLDLMSSVFSHLPGDRVFSRVVGLGMNAQELEANAALSERVVHDLNADPRLPFEDAAFDAVVCASSVEYLTRPFEVFGDVARVLKPGGVLAVTWSTRWFPPKVTKLWRDAHPYERLGIVLEYFQRSGTFTALESLAVSGYPRPDDDPHAHETDLSDPVFAVWGRRA